jgi:hypothetical protein
VLKTSIAVWAVLILSGALASSRAQVPLTDAEDIARVNDFFRASSPDALKCSLDQWSPTLGFDFRFVTGYAIGCRLSVFEGKQVTLINYVRVTPEGSAPTLLASVYRIPEITPEMLRLAGGKLEKMKNEFAMSGAFCVGEGRYSVEVLVRDSQGRTFRKKWRLHVAARHSERDVRLAMKPLTVTAIDQSSWQTVSSLKGGNLRLTILLDAAPINPYQSRLHAWDRAFLLECIYSLLRQTPHQSVRLVAFNLEQQREVFRANPFDSAAFLHLSRALEDIETASISVQALKQRHSPLLLAALAGEELKAAEHSDAVIFLGPNSRMDVDIRAGIFTENRPLNPPFFYFEYFPWQGSDFPDAIERLTKAADGKTYQIHSPAELDQAIEKMLAQLKQE